MIRPDPPILLVDAATHSFFAEQLKAKSFHIDWALVMTTHAVVVGAAIGMQFPLKVHYIVGQVQVFGDKGDKVYEDLKRQITEWVTQNAGEYLTLEELPVLAKVTELSGRGGYAKLLTLEQMLGWLRGGIVYGCVFGASQPALCSNLLHRWSMRGGSWPPEIKAGLLTTNDWLQMTKEFVEAYETEVEELREN